MRDGTLTRFQLSAGGGMLPTARKWIVTGEREACGRRGEGFRAGETFLAGCLRHGGVLRTRAPVSVVPRRVVPRIA